MRNVRIYVGSSEEGLAKARALAALLEELGDATLWKDGFFELGHFSAEDVREKAAAYDFSVHLVTPDLTAEGGRDEWLAALLEFGMFMSILGRDRAFLLVEHGIQVELPESIRGLKRLVYKPRKDMTAAIGNVLQPFRQAVERLGTRKTDLADGLKRLDTCSVYLAAPHQNTTDNKAVASTLERHGISVGLPNDLVKGRQTRTGSPSVIRKLCVDAIVDCKSVVVDLDTYGLDTAWEIGFADAREIDVIGLSRSPSRRTMLDRRSVNRKSYKSNFMHGWDAFQTFESVSDLEAHCRGRNVYVCGSFKNESGMEAIRSSQIRGLAESLVIPKDEFKVDGVMDHGVSYITRQSVIRALAQADLAVVLLPRYGMDTSWQLGYAAGLGTETVGLIGEDDHRDVESSRIWDHWMHGWRGKVVLFSAEDVAALLLGRSVIDCP